VWILPPDAPWIRRSADPGLHRLAWRPLPRHHAGRLTARQLFSCGSEAI